MKWINTFMALGAFAVASFTFSEPSRAQEATATPRPTQRPSSPNDTLKSTEVLADRRVTFRIYAPKAAEVSVTGDWVGHSLGASGKLTKDDTGVWSCTIDPLPPDFYSYMFTVDGVRTADPKNPWIKPGLSGLDNIFFVPGSEAAFADNQTVPHGEIRQVWYSSSVLNTQRRMHIYTPPGYEQSSDKLPVLYLLHGGGDEDSGWSTIGRAGFIMDNLLAAGRAKPMIVVMPNGSMPRRQGSTGSTTDRDARTAAQDTFRKELMEEVIPFVEKHYRVKAEPASRALAGLSMGGGQTLRVFRSHPEQFGYVAIWSAGMPGQNAEQSEERYADLQKNTQLINQSVKLLSICVGDKDFALNGSKNLAALLDKFGIKHELIITGGGHTWINWRKYLSELGPRLFN